MTALTKAEQIELKKIDLADITFERDRLRAENKELLKILDAAVNGALHHPACRAAKPGHDIIGRCNCWKAPARAALAKAKE